MREGVPLVDPFRLEAPPTSPLDQLFPAPVRVDVTEAVTGLDAESGDGLSGRVVVELDGHLPMLGAGQKTSEPPGRPRRTTARVSGLVGMICPAAQAFG